MHRRRRNNRGKSVFIRELMVDLKWNDSDKTLTISDRKGSFAGMKERMDFNIVIVTPESGTGIYQSKVNKSIVYEGKSMVISL